MELLDQLFQKLQSSDGLSGWIVALVGAVVTSLVGLTRILFKWYGNKKEGDMNKGQNDSLAESIKAIQKLHNNANYEQAYTEFYKLCDDYPGYQSEAEAILSRFRNIQKKYTHGILPEQQKDTFEMQIRHAFQTCLQRFKHEFLTSN